MEKDEIIKLSDISKQIYKKIKLDRVKCHQAAEHIMDSYRAVLVNQTFIHRVQVPMLGVIRPTHASAEKHLADKNQSAAVIKQLKAFLEAKENREKKRTVKIIKELYAKHGLEYDGRKTLAISKGTTPRDIQQETDTQRGSDSG